MSPVIYQILHIVSLLILFGYTFYAFSAPAETRKRVMLITGIASLVALVAGFGLQAKLVGSFPGWLIVKIVCWLGLSAIAGLAYRRRGAARPLAAIAITLAIVAVIMVYRRPF